MMQDIKFENGRALHEQGRLGEAAQIYKAVLAIDGTHAESMHWLGVIAYQTGNTVKAAELIRRSLTMRPNAPVFLFNWANILQASGHSVEAVRYYSAAIAAKPDYVDAYINRGGLFFALGRLEEALASYEMLSKIDAKTPEAFYNQAVILVNLKRYREAILSFDRAIQLRPGYIEAHYNRAKTFKELCLWEEATSGFENVIALNADWADAYNELGTILISEKRLDEAIAMLGKAITLNPKFAEAHHNYGNVLTEMRRLEEALVSYDAAIALNQDYAQALSSRGYVLLELDRLEEAIANFDRALRLQPSCTDAHHNRGNALSSLARFNAAAASYETALACEPGHPDVYCARGALRLRLGDMRGWEDFEWRNAQKVPRVRRNYLQPPLVSLADAQGKSVLVHWEQGLGDTIQFSRYVRCLRDWGANVLFAPQPQLRTLMASLGEDIQLVDAEDPSLVFDYHVPLMSLPLIFEGFIPSVTPYLSGNSLLIKKWLEKIGADGFRIGICWQGSSFQIDKGRSFKVAQFEALAAIPGVRLISLHKGDGEVQLESLPRGMVVETLGQNFDAGPEAFSDTAAAMMNLDLVITSDTAVAHLAGALGVRTWVALQHVPSCLWMQDRADSPWYPSMRLFRQDIRGNWKGLFANMQVVLQDLIDQTRKRRSRETR